MSSNCIHFTGRFCLGEEIPILPNYFPTFSITVIVFNKPPEDRSKCSPSGNATKLLTLTRQYTWTYDVMDNLLAALGLWLWHCCHISWYWKRILINKAYALDPLGDTERSLQDMFHQATAFILACYDLPNVS